MDSITERQPALLSFDSDGSPVVIPVAELRHIANGRHSPDNEQIEAMANFIVEQVDG